MTSNNWESVHSCTLHTHLWNPTKSGVGAFIVNNVVRNMTLLFLLRYPTVNLGETFFYNNSFVSYVIDSPWKTIKDRLHFFKGSIITTWELLTWILAHDRGEHIPTLPWRIPYFAEKEQNTNEAKQLFGVYIKTHFPENWIILGNRQVMFFLGCFVLDTEKIQIIIIIII